MWPEGNDVTMKHEAERKEERNWQVCNFIGHILAFYYSIDSQIWPEGNDVIIKHKAEEKERKEEERRRGRRT